MDDLITRLRTLMAEVEARIQQGETLSDEDVSPKLQEALRLPQASGVLPEQPNLSHLSNDPKPLAPKTTSRDNYRREDASHLKDYVPRHLVHGEDEFPADDFIGTGDSDPLGHDEAIRR